MAERVPGYSKTGALVIGLLQILIAIALIGLQVAMFTEGIVIAFVSVGFWTGFFFIICGVLSVCSWKQNTKCLILAVMTMNIIASFVALLGLMTAVVSTIYGSYRSQSSTGPYGDRYTYDLSKNMGFSQVGLCVVEGILAIVGSALCCAGMCCTQPHEMQVMYMTTGVGATPQQNTMYVTPGTVISTTTTTGQVYPQATANASQGPAYPPQGNSYPQGPAYPQEGEKPPPYAPCPDGNKA